MSITSYRHEVVRGSERQSLARPPRNQSPPPLGATLGPALLVESTSYVTLRAPYSIIERPCRRAARRDRASLSRGRARARIEPGIEGSCPSSSYPKGPPIDSLKMTSLAETRGKSEQQFSPRGSARGSHFRLPGGRSRLENQFWPGLHTAGEESMADRAAHSRR